VIPDRNRKKEDPEILFGSSFRFPGVSLKIRKRLASGDASSLSINGFVPSNSFLRAGSAVRPSRPQPAGIILEIIHPAHLAH